MATLQDAARIAPDGEGTIGVTFRDIPEAHTFGQTVAEARQRAVDVLETMLSARVVDGRPLPPPATEAPRGEELVRVSTGFAIKLRLNQVLRDLRVSKSELARRMGVHNPQVDRVLDYRHESTLSQLEAACRALGLAIEATAVEIQTAEAQLARLLDKAEVSIVGDRLRLDWNGMKIVGDDPGLASVSVSVSSLTARRHLFTHQASPVTLTELERHPKRVADSVVKQVKVYAEHRLVGAD